MKTRADLRDAVRQRLGDLDGAIWTDEELNLQLATGYRQLANDQDVFFDRVYLENLPAAASLQHAWEAAFVPRVWLSIATSEAAICSYTHAWEQIFVTRNGWIDNGYADYTARWEPDVVPLDSILTRGFAQRGPANHTQTFEETDGKLTVLGLQAARIVLRTRIGGIQMDVANYTAAFELALATDVADERSWMGPAVATAIWEVTEGYLSRAGADGGISATADVPKNLTALNRVTWDRRGLDIFTPRQMQQVDARYELTAGEVYGLMWDKDGLRTVRKIRKPAAQCDVVTLSGDLVGVMRSCSDLSADTVTGAYGTPRRIPGHDPIGPERFGTGRRPFLEGKNVRLEHFRQGRPLDADSAVCELPDRYALYLRDFVQAKVLARNGPGQDLALAQHFEQRWARGLARIAKRRDLMNREKTIVLGGEYRGLARRPPRPSLPWQYGRTVR